MIGRSGDLKTVKQRIEEDGFAVLPDVLDGCTISVLCEKLSGISRGRAGTRHLHLNPAVAALANDPRLLAIASAYLGPSAFCFRATLFDKSPDANWLITWHQDTALPVHERREAEGWSSWSVKDQIHYAHAPADALAGVLALRVHLDDSTCENGPLRVLPGSHLSGVLNEDEIAQMAAQHGAAVCLVNKGGIVAMRPLIIHASSKSRSFPPRRVLHIEYASSCELPGGLRLAAIIPSQISTTPS